MSGLAITHIFLALMLQGNLMVDSTDFCTGGNENAASIIPSDRCGQKLELGWTAAGLLPWQAAQKGRQQGRSE